MNKPADQGFVAQIRLETQGQSPDSATVTRNGNRLVLTARDLQVEATLCGGSAFARLRRDRFRRNAPCLFPTGYGLSGDKAWGKRSDS